MKRNGKNNKRNNRKGKGARSTKVSQYGGYADRTRVKLVYIEDFELTFTTAPVNHIWSGNGCFDPDITHTGSQPANYDDWSAVYNKYRVHSSSIEISFSSTWGSVPVIGSLAARHASTAITSFAALDNMRAQPYCNFTVLSGPISVDGKNHFKMNVSTQRFLGMPSATFLGDDDVSAAISANPVRQWYWHFVMAASDLSTDVVTEGTARIVYDVEFYDRVDTSLDLKIERMISLRDAKAKRDEGCLLSLQQRVDEKRSKSQDPADEDSKSVEGWIEMKSTQRPTTSATSSHPGPLQRIPTTSQNTRAGCSQRQVV